MKIRLTLLSAFICAVCTMWADSAKLDSLLYKNLESPERITNPAVVTSGYRVQIYSNNKAQVAKQGAFDVEKEIKEVFPDIHTYISFNAPFWKVRLGDFPTYYEALNFSNYLKDTFPERATEVFVVKEENIKPIYFDEINNDTEKLEKAF